jgi:DNA-3-methyladenine glycosylase
MSKAMQSSPLIPRSFYLRPVEVVAPDLLGKLLCGSGVILKITEVEAYGGPEDSASHCRFGKTPRNAPMWGMGGHCYVYLCYGVHQMLNVVTGGIGEGAAVLIRACEVLSGHQSAAARRKIKMITPGQPVCDGPGKVTQVLAIDRSYNNHPLFESGGLELREGRPPDSVKRAKRIGIDYAKENDKSAPLRFIGNDYV